MTHDDKPRVDLEAAISAVRNDEPDPKAVEAAGGRILARLRADAASIEVEQIRGCADVRTLLPAYHEGRLPAARALLVRDHLHECVGCRNLAAGAEARTGWKPLPAVAPRWGVRQWAMAAAALVVIGVSALLLDTWYFAAPAGMRARVQTVQGTVYRVSALGERPLAVGDELAEGELVRTGGGAHAFLALHDGSVVEMNQRSEFAVSARRNDTTVKLDRGDIIVQAAKRRTGHLYVVTPDCRVAVTGTVFSVNSGMKGSRVAVIEGAVRVSHAGQEQLLHPGEQTATSDSMETMPVREEIAWSRDLDKHLALLAQFAILKDKFEQIPTPGLRFASNILPRVPANTIVYATIPNLGDALSEANRIFQEQLQQSTVLREWWYSGKKDDRDDLDKLIGKIHALSEYLGDEVVVVGLSGHYGGEQNAAIVSEVRRPGLSDFLQTEFTELDGQGSKHGDGIRVITPAQLVSMPAVPVRGLLALVRPDFVLFSGSVSTLQLLNAQLNAASSGFAGTDFGQQIQNAYNQGAGFLLAANLQQIIADTAQRQPLKQPRKARSEAEFQRSGFRDMKYVFISHRDVSGTPDNRAVLQFASARHGIASWLAAPAPMGSLEFVSANAGLAVSGIAKSPVLMLDDILQFASDGKSQRELAKLESELNLSLRDDLAAAFGGEATFALDGPILPTPSWKLIAEVTDSARLQNSIQQLVAAVNRHAAEHSKPGLQLEHQESNGQTFYALRSLDSRNFTPEVHYTFTGSYVIFAPSRALLANALLTKASPENSLARSSDFRGLLPKDAYADFSGVFYQNLAPVLQPIASQLTPQQLQSLQQLASLAKPTVICAYGSENRIEVASASGVFPFDPSLMAMTALLGQKQPGTSVHPRP